MPVINKLPKQISSLYAFKFDPKETLLIIFLSDIFPKVRIGVLL